MIVLEILKWIGISILILIGLVLLIVLLIVFVPIRYKGALSYDKSTMKLPYARVQVSFLLFVVRVKAVFDEKLNLVVRVFGIPIIKSDAAKNQGKASEYEKLTEFEGDETDAEPGSVESEANDVSGESEDSTCETSDVDNIEATEDAGQNVTEAIEAADHAEGEHPEDEHPADDAENVENTYNAGNAEDEAPGEENQKKSLKDKLTAFLDGLRYKKEKIYDKMKDVSRNLDFYLELWDSKEMKETLALVKKYLGKLFKSILPRKLKGEVAFGFPDPATTGTVMSYASMLYILYGDHLSMQPQFDVEELAVIADLKLKGHFSVFTLIRIGLKVYFNKNLKRVLYKLKHKDKFIAKKYHTQTKKSHEQMNESKEESTDGRQ